MAYFQDRNYSLDDGTVVRMRVDRNDLFDGNTQAAGTPLVWVANKRQPRSPGLAVRQLKLRVQIVPENPAQGIPGVYRYRNVTVLTKATYDTIEQGDIVKFGAADYIVHRKLPEVNKV